MQLLIRAVVRARASMVRRLEEPERGDVPGWVLVTLMTAGLVAVIWGVAEDKFIELFQQAIDSVTNRG